MNKVSCDFCGSSDLDPVYEVPDSVLGVSVAACSYCGLIQSLQTLQKKDERIISLSSGAGWGNIRHGKGLRFQAALPVLQSTVPWNQVDTVLDIGSNRGHFVQWLRASKPAARITAIEPDTAIIQSYRDLPGLDLHADRFEAVPLTEGAFDFIYSCQTLEHATSASSMLEKSASLLRCGGWMYLEVPNLESIGEAEVVEEFFIDKHTFHFNRSLLGARLEALGFEIVWGKQELDRANITFLGQLRERKNAPQAPNPDLAEANRMLICTYVEVLKHNRQRLSRVADRLYEFMGRQRVVIWGAGRIFDALIRYGNLRTDRIFGLVDSYLAEILPEAHGVPIWKPEFLRITSPDVVIVLARSSTDEIVKIARRHGIRHVILFKELFASC